MLDRVSKLACVALVAACAAIGARADDLLVDDAARADKAVAAALDGRFPEAAMKVSGISRLDERDAAFFRISVIASRRASAEVAANLAKRISNAGVGRDANMEIAIAMARRGRLAAAEAKAANLDPKRRDRVRAVISMMQAERQAFRQAWLTARQTNDLTRRRESLITMRGGLSVGLSTRAAIGAALGAENQVDRIRSLVAVARGLVVNGKRADGLTVLGRVHEELRKGLADSALIEEVAADRAMILLAAGDIAGARAAAGQIRDGALRKYLIRHIDETRKFSVE